MNNQIYRITLDVQKTNTQTYLNVKKDDTGRNILFTLTDGGKPYELTSDCTATFRAKKPDGTILYNSCTIADNVITYTLTSQTSAAVGILECELTIYGSSNKQLTSPRFAMLVENNLYSDSEIESEDEFTQLNQAITNTNNLNVTISKSGQVTTITVTHKNGTTQSVNIYDGDTSDCEKLTNKVTAITSSSTDTQYASAKAVYTAIQESGGGTDNEKTANKVTTISSSSTHTQYPSAKAVYNYVNEVLTTIENANY